MREAIENIEAEGNSSFEELDFLGDERSDEHVSDVVNHEAASPYQVCPIDRLIQTIDNMSPVVNDSNSSSGVIPSTFCAHPVHLHSLTGLTNLSSLLRSRFKTCAVCSARISLVAGNVVTCLACEIFVHRKCAKSENFQVCAVNKELLTERRRFMKRNSSIPSEANEANEANEGTVREQYASDPTIVEKDIIHPQRQDNDDLIPEIVRHEDAFSSCSEDSDSSGDGVWSDSGPPAHWALSSDAPSVFKGITSQSKSKARSLESDGISSDGQEQEWKSSFSNLSRVLQRNLFMNRNENDFKKDKEPENNTAKSQTTKIVLSTTSSTESNDKDIMENSKSVIETISRTIQTEESVMAEKDDDAMPPQENMEAVLEEAAPNPPSPTKTQRVVKGTVDVMRKTNQTKKNIGVASIAGGVAGAAAGLIVGGPAGLYLGSKIGQVLGFGVAVIEGSVGVGVIVAGVTGTVLVKQMNGGGNRMITIGGGKGSEKVYLVRPNVVVDSIWEEITAKVRRSAPTDNVIENFALFGEKKAVRNERKRRDRDIVFSEENEINTRDKVFLLVASSLNDKTSLPGYVYRELIIEVKNRAESRKHEKITDKVNDSSRRAIRQDVHGIIKHITATLLEVRPGFSSSARITEMSARTVETIVFGEIYDIVMEEIRNETLEKDRSLSIKFQNLIDEADTAEIETHTYISDDALLSIKMMPKHHSVEEKLRCCVEVLEYVSNVGSNANMGADFLLTLVCQHLAIASVPVLNAEISFLEEYATDEQLLQGKEGYALVTIQASIHFLNASKNLLEDLFLDVDNNQ